MTFKVSVPLRGKGRIWQKLISEVFAELPSKVKFPSPCGEKVVSDCCKRIRYWCRFKVSVPLRGKERIWPNRVLCQTVSSHIEGMPFPSPCGGKIVSDLIKRLMSGSRSRSFRPLAGKRSYLTKSAYEVGSEKRIGFRPLAGKRSYLTGVEEARYLARQVLFPSPCGEKVVSDYYGISYRGSLRQKVSVPLRGKARIWPYA